MTFGIGIPCWQADSHFLQNLIENISKQTVLPDMISISLSQSENFKIENDYGLNIILTQTKEPKLHSENRNIAASKLETDIISFIDSDDLMHPQRTEFILDGFKRGAQAILHNFEPSKQFVYLPNTQTLEEFMMSSYHENEFFLEVISNISSRHLYPIWNETTTQHNAHVTVLKSLFDKHYYDPQFGWTADSDFNTRLVIGGCKISYIKNKLSWYRLK